MIRTLLYLAFGLFALPFAQAQEEIEVTFRDHFAGVVQGTRVLISHNYEYLYRINEADSLYWACQNGLWGVISLSGRVQIPLQYHLRHESDLYLDGDCYLTAQQPIALRNADGRWGAINYLGKVLLPFQYDFVYAHRSGADDNWNWYYDFYVERKGKVQCIRHDGKVEKMPYKHFGGPAYHPSANQTFWLSKDGKSYVLYALPEDAELSMKAFQTELATLDPLDVIAQIVHHKGQYYLLDNQGKKISKGYDHLNVDYDRPIVYATKKGKKGLLSLHGQEWLPCTAQDAEYAYQKGGIHVIAYRLHVKAPWRFKVSKDGKTFSDLPVEASDFELYYYREATEVYSIAVQNINSKWGTVDLEGKYLLPCEYDAPIMFDLNNPTQYIPIKKGDLYAYVNAQGQFLTPFEFDQADLFYPDLTDKAEPLRAEVKKGNKKGKLCLDAKVIWD